MSENGNTPVVPVTPGPGRSGRAGKTTKTPEERAAEPWVSNWCRAGAQSWSHERCAGTYRNGMYAARPMLLCECPDLQCVDTDRHAHTEQELAASKVVADTSGVSRYAEPGSVPAA